MRARLFAVIVLAVAATLAVPTLAMTTGGSDQVDSVVKLSAHDGPNGEYATVGDGEIRVDFEQLNDEAVTRAHDVFDVTSTADSSIEVWVEADPDGVVAYEGEDPGAVLDGAEGRVLQPGETLPVGFAIDTHGSTPDHGTVTIRVEDREEDSAGGGTGAGSSGAVGSGGTGGGGGVAPVTSGGGVDVAAPSAGVEADFTAEGDYASTTIRELVSLPADGASQPPTAEIGPGRMLTDSPEDGLTVHGTRFVAQEDRPLRLTASQSYLSTAESVAREPRPAAVVEITPPAELRDSPADVRIRVARDRFPATDATDAQVGRHTPEGWQLIPTRVVEADDETVVLEARTQGFSVFTVFAESEVGYEWTFPDGRTVQGNHVRTTFVEDGPKTMKLTVTDAFGRSDVARQEILVNDQPSVAIEQRRNDTDGDLTTLRANVTDEYGNSTVTWTLPDGSTATGETVTGDFERGETVSVTVQDEYGASTTAETTVGPSTAGRTGLSRLPFSLPLWAGVLLAVTATAVAATVARVGLPGWARGTVGALGRAVLTTVADDSPRIERFEEPVWNPVEDRLEIGTLEVVAPGGTLGAVEIAVIDDSGRTVVTRTVETGATDTYSASPEYVPVYGGLDLDGGGYTVEVRAVDERDRLVGTPQTQRRPVGVGA